MPSVDTPDGRLPAVESLADIDDRWQAVFRNVGLERPGETRLIMVFRVILTVTHRDYPTQGSTEAGPNCEPVEVLTGLLEPWSELFMGSALDTVKLTLVHAARKTACDPVLCNPTYVLTLTTDPFQRGHPHGLMEVTWGCRSWFGAVALPRWINIYSCQALLASLCGPVPEGVQEARLNGITLTTVLVECHTGSFLQISLTWQNNSFIMDDVHMAFAQKLHFAHLPLKTAPDNERKITVYVANGRTCYTSTSPNGARRTVTTTLSTSALRNIQLCMTPNSGTLLSLILP